MLMAGRAMELALQLLEGAEGSLGDLLRHPVELPALAGGALEGLVHHVEGDEALGHLVLQGGHGLSGQRGDVQERVVSCVDELQEVLPLELARGADLAEDEGQLLESVLVAHGDVSEHLEVPDHRLGAHAESEHGLRGLLGAGAVPEGLVGVFVDLAQHLRRLGLVADEDVECGGRLLGLHPQLRDDTHPRGHGHDGVGEELGPGDRPEGVSQAADQARGEAGRPVDGFVHGLSLFLPGLRAADVPQLGDHRDPLQVRQAFRIDVQVIPEERVEVADPVRLRSSVGLL